MNIKAELEWTFLRNIGAEGLNSEVFLAHDPQIDAEIVVKKIPKKAFVDHNQFFNEAQVMYGSKHNNVVEVKYACSDCDSIYLAMPFYQKGSLNNLINTRMLTVREIIKYSLDFLNGLNNVHVKNLVHFDIKPTNILLGNDGRAMITDFGLAKQLNNWGLATPDFMYGKHFTPEAFLHGAFTNQADIFQAGLTLYRMCNGNESFNKQWDDAESDQKNAILKGVFPNRKAYLPHIPKKMRTIINKCLECDLNKRYNSVIKVINDISSIEKSLDWEYYNCNGNKCLHRWKIEDKNAIKELLIESNGIEFDVTGKKIMKKTGKETRINAWCKKNVNTIEDAMKFVELTIQS